MYAVVDKIILNATPFCRRHSGVIHTGNYALSFQVGSHFFGAFTRQAVDDATLATMTAYYVDDGAQAFPFLICFAHIEAQIRAVETADENARIAQTKLLYNIGLSNLVGSGRKCKNRHIGETLGEHSQLCILRAEIMPPLRHTVRFVDGNHRHFYAFLQSSNLSHKALRRDVENFYLATAATVENQAIGIFVVAAIQSFGFHAVGLQGIHLVLHQRNERRHHQCHAIEHKSRYLVANRLASACWHQHQSVASGHHIVDNFLLLRAKGIIAVYRFQKLICLVH